MTMKIKKQLLKKNDDANLTSTSSKLHKKCSKSENFVHFLVRVFRAVKLTIHP